MRSSARGVGASEGVAVCVGSELSEVCRESAASPRARGASETTLQCAEGHSASSSLAQGAYVCVT